MVGIHLNITRAGFPYSLTSHYREEALGIIYVSEELLLSSSLPLPSSSQLSPSSVRLKLLISLGQSVSLLPNVSKKSISDRPM